MACVYKSENTDVFLKLLLATNVFKFTMLMPVLTFQFKILLPSSISTMNLAILVATSDVRNSPVNTNP